MYICKKMTTPKISSNRNTTINNYFSSYQMAEYLFGLTFIGPLKKNKKEVLPEFILDKNRMLGTSITGGRYDKTLVSYVTKNNKVVLLFSTMHDSIEVDQKTLKPVQTVGYISINSKGVVDTADSMCSIYTTARKIKRWPVVIFFFRELDNSWNKFVKHFSRKQPRIIVHRETVSFWTSNGTDCEKLGLKLIFRSKVCKVRQKTSTFFPRNTEIIKFLKLLRRKYAKFADHIKTTRPV